MKNNPLTVALVGLFGLSAVMISSNSAKMTPQEKNTVDSLNKTTAGDLNTINAALTSTHAAERQRMFREGNTNLNAYDDARTDSAENNVFKQQVAEWNKKHPTVALELGGCRNTVIASTVLGGKKRTVGTMGY